MDVVIGMVRQKDGGNGDCSPAVAAAVAIVVAVAAVAIAVAAVAAVAVVSGPEIRSWGNSGWTAARTIKQSSTA